MRVAGVHSSMSLSLEEWTHKTFVFGSHVLRDTKDKEGSLYQRRQGSDQGFILCISQCETAGLPHIPLRRGVAFHLELIEGRTEWPIVAGQEQAEPGFTTGMQCHGEMSSSGRGNRVRQLKARVRGPHVSARPTGLGQVSQIELLPGVQVHLQSNKLGVLGDLLPRGKVVVHF